VITIFVVTHFLFQSPDELPIDEESPVALNIPKELWRIVDYLYQNGLFEEELFAVRGSYRALSLSSSDRRPRRR
jgi:hypothetical protein